MFKKIKFVFKGDMMRKGELVFAVYATACFVGMLVAMYVGFFLTNVFSVGLTIVIGLFTLLTWASILAGRYEARKVKQ